MTPIQAYYLLHEGTLALARAERNGIRVDVEYLEEKISDLEKQICDLEDHFKSSRFYSQWKGFQGKEPNPNSSVQLANYLYGELQLVPPKLTATGRGSTDKESLTELNIPELNAVLEARKLKKIKDYLEGFRREQTDGWLHPSFNLHLARTFRSSSDSPNFQNIPKRDKLAMDVTRRALYPRRGHQLLEVDYGALEVRIAACYHKDPTMLQYIKTDHDMHADMAQQIFMIDDFDKHRDDHAVLRGATKNGFVFPQFYGDYFVNCAEYMACDWGGLPKKGGWRPGQGVALDGGTLGGHLRSKGIKNLEDFIQHVKEIEQDFWGKRFRQYARWKERWWHEYQKTGYIDMLTGFRCKGLMGKNDAINYPIQGSAFHCLLWSFIELDKMLVQNKWRSRIIGQIHDAIVLDVYPPELPMLVKHIVDITTKKLPEAWNWISVPLTVEFEICDVDTSWADKKELEI